MGGFSPIGGVGGPGATPETTPNSCSVSAQGVMQSGPAGWSGFMLAAGHYRVRHFLGTTAYNAAACPATVSGTPETRSYSVQILDQTADFVELQITDSAGALVSSGFNFILVPIRQL